MRTTTVREIRQNFPRVLAWIQDGEQVAVTMRRKVVARLIPEPQSPVRKVAAPDFAAVGRKAFGKRLFTADAMEIEREDYKF